MSTGSLRERRLVQLYYRYVGEPERMRDVYGYWLFLLGCVGGLAGIVFYLVEQALFPGDLAIREIAIIAAAGGLTIGLFGMVVLLPVRRNGILASLLGLIVAFVGIGLFSWSYPHAWYVPPDYSAEIIAVYGSGITLIAVVAALVPIITGKRALLVEPELGLGSDDPPVLLGKADRDAFYAVYQTPSKEWTWRMIQRDAIAESTEVALSDTDTRMVVEDVRETIGKAGLLDLTTASFRLYRTDQDTWRWSLIRQDGSILAVSPEELDSRESVESTVTFLKDHLPTAELVEIRGAAFDIFRDDADRWQWRLIDDQRNPLARGGESLAREDDATAAADRFVSRLTRARVLAIEDVGIELVDAEDGWQWRIVTASDTSLVSSESSYPTREDVEPASERVAQALSGAPTVDYGQSGFEIVPGDRGWSWRLRATTDELIADHAGDSTGRETAEAAAERTRTVLADAETMAYEGADFEVYRSGEGWAWRLVSTDRHVLAESVESFPDESAANTTAAAVQEGVLAAELIEFDEAAFQQYESDGEWRWRLIDEDGTVLADSGEEFGSKEAVRDGMTTLKEHAPNAEVLEIETAAIEIYRTSSNAYAWRLIDEGGQLIAEGADVHPTRSDARQAVEFLTESVGGAAVREMSQAAFQLVQVDAGWTARLIDVDGTILATTREVVSTKDEAREAVDRIRTAGTDAPIDVLDDITVVLRSDGEWHWELMDPDRNRVGVGTRTYEDRDAAVSDVEILLAGAGTAPTFTIDEGIVWAKPDANSETWDWSLIRQDRTELGVGEQSYDSLDALLKSVDRIKSLAPDADRFEIDTIAFEVQMEADSWQWRVLDEDESVLAESPGETETEADALEGMDRARNAAEEASILEIDEPAFEFHERDDGWIWRLIDQHGTALAESVDSHDTRQQAQAELQAAKDFGPAGETVVTW